MTIKAVKEKTSQPLSIHLLSTPKICRFFSVKEADADLKDLIARVVSLYNKTLKSEDPYRAIDDIEQPHWKVHPFTPFQMRVYVQTIQTTSRLSSWLQGLGTQENLVVQRVQYLFFLFREREINKKPHKEIFALTTGQAWWVVQKFSSYEFPIQIVKRLMNPELFAVKKRALVGSVLMMSEVLKQETEVSDSDSVDKLFTRAKFGFRKDASIFTLSCFQTAKGNPLARGMSAEIGLGLVRLTKNLSMESYPEVLHLFSQIVHNEKTSCTDGTNETDSLAFEFLEHFQPTSFTKVPQLEKALVEILSAYMYQGAQLPAFDFCHKYRSGYFQADTYRLLVDSVKVAKWDLPPSAAVVMEALKARCVEKKITADKFPGYLENWTFAFTHQGKTESAPLAHYFEGELRTKTGEIYWRLHTVWYEIQADYLGLVHEEFRKVLNECLLAPAVLPELWPSPPVKEARKKALNGARYDVEAEYNQKYLGRKGYFLGDKVCPEGIELGDVFRVGEELQIFHVKEGFGQSTRDACSQVLNSAKLLHHHGGKMRTATQVVDQFYQMSLKGGDVYRNQLKAEMEKVDKKTFLSYFSKKIVFVYAFADDTKGQRLLSAEKEIKVSLAPQDLEGAHKKFKGMGKNLHAALVQEEYLSKTGKLTSKYLSCPKKNFSLKILSVKAQAEALFDCLAKFKTQFDSTIAKLELISLREELRKMGYAFKILQINRDDYKKEAAIAPSKAEPIWVVPDLPEIEEDELAKIRGDIGEGDTFTDEEDSYLIAPTTGDGACGLHALAGEKAKGSRIYTYPGKHPNAAARAEFIKRLRENIGEDEILELWRTWMVHFVMDHLGKGQTAYTKMVFDQVPDQIEELEANLADLDEENTEYQNEQKELLSQASELDDYQEALGEIVGFPMEELKKNPQQLLGEFQGSLDEIIEGLEGEDVAESLSANLHKLSDLRTRRDDAFLNFVDTDEVWEAYLEGIANPGYYFSTQEIGIGAHLFEKHVIVYGHTHLDQVDKSLDEGNPDHPEVVIFHKGIHFSRCEALKK